MADNDAWASPSGGSEEPLPSGTDLLSKTANTVIGDFAMFLVSGLAPGLLTFGITMVSIFVIYGVFVAGMILGEGDETILMGTIIGFVVLLLGMIFGLTALTAPMVASMYRAVWSYLETGEKLTPTSAFSTMGQDVGRVVLYQFVHMFLVGLGMTFCYAPGLIVAAALSFAGPAIYIHRLGIGQAISLSVGHLQRHPTWHIVFCLFLLLINIVMQNIPILGMILAFSVPPLFVLLAYRAAFGTGELPRGYEE